MNFELRPLYLKTEGLKYEAVENIGPLIFFSRFLYRRDSAIILLVFHSRPVWTIGSPSVGVGGGGVIFISLVSFFVFHF